MQGPSHSAASLGGRASSGGRREEKAISPSLVGQSLRTCTHTWGRGRQHDAGWFQLDMLTCRRVTPLPRRKGRRGCKGHGGGQLKREAVGKGLGAPGVRVQSQNKKKRWRMESKNRTKNCQLNTGERAEGLTPAHHIQHTPGEGPQQSPPLSGVLFGMEGVTGPPSLGASRSVLPSGCGTATAQSRHIWKVPGCGKGPRLQPRTRSALGLSSGWPQGCSPPAAACRPC